MRFPVCLILLQLKTVFTSSISESETELTINDEEITKSSEINEILPDDKTENKGGAQKSATVSKKRKRKESYSSSDSSDPSDLSDPSDPSDTSDTTDRSRSIETYSSPYNQDNLIDFNNKAIKLTVHAVTTMLYYQVCLFDLVSSYISKLPTYKSVSEPEIKSDYNLKEMLDHFISNISDFYEKKKLLNAKETQKIKYALNKFKTAAKDYSGKKKPKKIKYTQSDIDLFKIQNEKNIRSLEYRLDFNTELVKKYFPKKYSKDKTSVLRFLMITLYDLSQFYNENFINCLDVLKVPPAIYNTFHYYTTKPEHEENRLFYIIFDWVMYICCDRNTLHNEKVETVLDKCMLTPGFINFLCLFYFELNPQLTAEEFLKNTEFMNKWKELIRKYYQLNVVDERESAYSKALIECICDITNIQKQLKKKSEKIRINPKETNMCKCLHKQQTYENLRQKVIDLFCLLHLMIHSQFNLTLRPYNQ